MQELISEEKQQIEVQNGRKPEKMTFLMIRLESGR